MTDSPPAGWTLDESGKALVRSVKFKDFSEAFAFLTRVALHAEKVDHIPSSRASGTGSISASPATTSAA